MSCSPSPVIFLFLFAQLVECCTNNAKVVGLIPRQNKNIYTLVQFSGQKKKRFTHINSAFIQSDIFASISPLDTSVSSKKYLSTHDMCPGSIELSCSLKSLWKVICFSRSQKERRKKLKKISEPF